MSYTLRPYQQAASDTGWTFLTTPAVAGKENGVIVIPTGGGKSLVIASLVSRLPGASIVLQPSKELLEQNAEKLMAYGYRPAIFSASAGQKKIGPLTLATIGSVIRCKDMFRHVKYALVDECHLVNSKVGKNDEHAGMYDEFFKNIPGLRILGLTATPYRLSNDGFNGSVLKFITRTRPRIFSQVVHVTQNRELVDKGYWAKLEYKIVNSGFREDRLRINSTGADYTDESVRNHFRELNFDDQIVRCVHRLEQLNRIRTLIFCRFVEQAKYVVSQIPGAAMVTGQTPNREREQIVAGFKSGRIPVIANVGVFITGFDYPELSNVILAQPTRSLSRAYQMIGRVVRPHPDKAVAYIVDMVGIVDQFGRMEDLSLVDGGNGKWHVENNGKQLTNVAMGKPMPKWLQNHILGKKESPPIQQHPRLNLTS